MAKVGKDPSTDELPLLLDPRLATDINNAMECYMDCEIDNLEDTYVCCYQWNSTNYKALIETTLFEAKEE